MLFIQMLLLRKKHLMLDLNFANNSLIAHVWNCFCTMCQCRVSVGSSKGFGFISNVAESKWNVSDFILKTLICCVERPIPGMKTAFLPETNANWARTKVSTLKCIKIVTEVQFYVMTWKASSCKVVMKQNTLDFSLLCHLLTKFTVM